MSSHESQSQHDGDPFFQVVVRPNLQRHDMEALSAGLCGALQVPGLLAEDQCDRFMAAFDSVMMDRYDPSRYERPIARFGPVLNEFISAKGLPAEYWRHASRAEVYWGELGTTADIRSACRRYLCEVWETGVETAAIAERDIFWGIVREANAGTLIHWDEVVRECPAPLQEIPVAQLACNVFVSVPEGGGATSVWRHRWQPADERHRFRFGYTENAVAPHPQITITPGLGDAVFFDSRNYHRAEETDGSGRRVSLSFFLGITTSGRLLIWS